MAVDIEYLTTSYFFFDKPVPYKLSDESSLMICPISVIDSEIFNSSIDILKIDKNTAPNVDIIQMSYLQFLIDVLIQIDDIFRQKFVNILVLCLGMKDPVVFRDMKQKPFIYDKELNVKITGQQFDDIKKIILYQNIIGYDDSYINPELKQAMAETDALKNKDYENPTLERKIAIITAHTGISKKEQLEMTYRSHCLLFNEVCGEVEFTTTRPIALLGSKPSELDHWIFKKKKDKFNGYVTELGEHINKFGGDGKLNTIVTDSVNNYEQMFNDFKGGN